MVRIDFRKVPVFTSIKKDKTEEVDISEVVANAIYMRVGGVVAHSLAMRIYEHGEVELNEREMAIIKHVTEGMAGVVADSIKNVLITDKQE